MLHCRGQGGSRRGTFKDRKKADLGAGGHSAGLDSAVKPDPNTACWAAGSSLLLQLRPPTKTEETY